ncbi:MAG TPA: polynucleotide adenylyltransferase PcnB [Spirochaetes bacterium]|nr:polynucleotide adenylyltransferase PcnB [Spirochaetota bacterium]
MAFFFRQRYPIVLSPDQHTISRAHVEREVLDIMRHLQRNGHQAFLVGGCVRDILLGKKPKDFDIATDARPRQVKKLFRKCFLIGRRFRLAHVYISKDRFVEVATFRAMAEAEQAGEGKYAANNVFGDIEEDALRRDFTMNALYFNAADSTIVDYSGGLRDIKKRVVRSIGDPVERFTDDPVRIIRAARFSAQLGFSLSRKDHRAALKCAPLIKQSSDARLLEELYKILRCGASLATLMNLSREGLLAHWLPEVSVLIKSDDFKKRIEAVDRRRREGADIPNAVLIAVLIYDLLDETVRSAAGLNQQDLFALLQGAHRDMVVRMRVPRREWDIICNIISRLDLFTEPRQGKTRQRNENRFIQNVNFGSALLFFEILSEATGLYREELRYWKKRAAEKRERPERAAVTSEQPSREQAPKEGKRRRRRPRRRGPRKPAETGAAPPTP